MVKALCHLFQVIFFDSLEFFVAITMFAAIWSVVKCTYKMIVTMNNKMQYMLKHLLHTFFM